MNFELVLRNLLEALDRRSVLYGAIGGFALGALGVPRATIDLDFLVQKEDLGELHSLLTELGYARTFMTDNVSQYRHKDSEWGSIDVLHAFRVHARAMLQRARDHDVFGGSMRVKVLDPEDIIGLKVQAMVNDPRRRAQDEADIEALMAAHGSHLDWVRLQEFFDLFDLGEQGRTWEKRYGHVDG